MFLVHLGRLPHVVLLDSWSDAARLGYCHDFGELSIQAGVKAYSALPASEDDPSRGVYVLLTQRLRFDGNVGGIKRKALEHGTKKAARSQLKSFKAYAESAAGG